MNFLYALEGGIEGKRWHYLPDDKKQDLKIVYKTL
nr:TfoX/Sxy family DNA transformation protein [Clostridium saccharoperbutylacetonicum]